MKLEKMKRNRAGRFIPREVIELLKANGVEVVVAFIVRGDR